jgi:Arc/MetJ-type ribon-helix-helix transcriptional regulator
MSSKETISFRVSEDDPVHDILENAENRSEFIRDALRDRGREVDQKYSDLTDKEQTAYTWLVKQCGGEKVGLRAGILEELSQTLSVNKALVERRILRKLDKKGYISYRQGFYESQIYVKLPAEVGE